MATPNLISGDTILSVELVGTVLTITVQSCCDPAPRVIEVELASLGGA
jgi:hypothetical protein